MTLINVTDDSLGNTSRDGSIVGVVGLCFFFYLDYIFTFLIFHFQQHSFVVSAIFAGTLVHRALR